MGGVKLASGSKYITCNYGSAKKRGRWMLKIDNGLTHFYVLPMGGVKTMCLICNGTFAVVKSSRVKIT